MNKEFNSTAEGQTKMFYDASSKTNAFIMAKFIRSKGEITWTDEQINGATGKILEDIKEDLLADYNRLAAK